MQGKWFGVGLLALVLFAIAHGPAVAQGYPSRPITLIVPYTPGSGIDIIARTIAPKLTERWGQPVIVDNKPGASGNIGADAVAKSAPNGDTLMVNVNTFAITPALYRSIPYDPLQDFTHVAKVATGNVALVVSTQALPVKTLDELAAAARAAPGKLFYSSPGNGTPQHLSMELLKQRLGLDIVHVPYKGAAGALSDLIAGQVHMAVLPVHTALPHAKAGKLNVIAVSGESRSVLAPDSPSFAEAGMKNLDIDLYFFVSGPAGLPPEIVAKLNQELAAIMAMPDVRAALLKQGIVATASTPTEITALLRADVARWKKFIGETKITAD